MDNTTFGVETLLDDFVVLIVVALKLQKYAVRY
jgi:hypothetical protein